MKAIHGRVIDYLLWPLEEKHQTYASKVDP